MTELDVILTKIGEHEVSMTQVLTAGRCVDFNEYKRVCGVIYGLGLVRIDIQDLRKKIEDYENE